MKIKKHPLLLIAALSAGAAAMLTSCGNGEEESVDPMAGLKGKTFDIEVWVSEIDGVADLTQTQIQRFATEKEVTINAEINTQKESDASSAVLKDIDAAADIYCFAQDQMSNLLLGNALARLGNSAKATVTELNDAGAVDAVTSGDYMYAYPMTSDNGYFMYYDKSVVQEAHIDSLEDIIADCEAAKRNFIMETETSAWYEAAFFFGAGCKSTWTIDNDGAFTSYDDDWNSEKGVVAAKGMQKLLKSNYYLSSSTTSDLSAATKGAVLVSGTWAYTDVQKILGDNMGVADLPSFTVDGKSYHLGSYCGNKLMGVKPQEDADYSTLCSQLALYLTNAKCQEERFDQFAWGPSNKEVAAMAKVQANPGQAALLKQNQYAVAQKTIPSKWWDIAKVVATGIKSAADDAAIKAVLKTYEDGLKQIIDDESIKADTQMYFTVRGSFNTAPVEGFVAWSTDLEMTASADKKTFTTAAMTLKAGDSFKCLQGATKYAWNHAFGGAYGGEAHKDDEGGNFVVSESEAGTNKKIQIVTEFGEDYLAKEDATKTIISIIDA